MSSRIQHFRKDLLAGLTVALVALPLAIAFGENSGLGATAGLTTAVIAGLIAAVFGGSRFQVSGPTGAMTVVLIPIFAAHGRSGVLLVGLMAGTFVLVAGILKIGRHVHRLPTSIIEGFTAGIAIVIGLGQLPSLFALSPVGHQGLLAQSVNIIARGFAQPSPLPVIVGLATGALVYFLPKLTGRIPAPILGITLATAANTFFGWNLTTVPSLNNVLGAPSVDFLTNLANLAPLIWPAVIVAALAALESLLSAKVADGMKNDGVAHDSDRELIGQGLANLVVPFFGGVPATAALARTAVNVRSGAVSRLAAASHAVILAGLVFGLGGFVELIPNASLAGVLIATATTMVKFGELKKTFRRSWLDAIALSTTLALTVLTDLSTALVVGAALWFSLRKTRLAAEIPPVLAGESLGD